MQPAPLLDTEAARLASLHEQAIMDTPFDPRFDNLVHLAAEVFEVPIAMVSLVDKDRQWFKAVKGLQVRETPREYAFCAHAILKPDEVMVVEDAARDPRFADNPLVQGNPNIRFYAGAVVRATDGAALGTLCLFDKVARDLSERGCAKLSRLADSVSELIALHHNASLMQVAATHDCLTGLANRANLANRLAAAVGDALAGSPCAFIMADLDHFKSVNDEYGHQAGDAVLVEVARRLRGVVRSNDLVSRLGGDEFAILLGDRVTVETALAVADRALAAFQEPFTIGGTRLRIGLSAGVAMCPADATDAVGLMRAADDALYVAKRAGRRSVFCKSRV